MKTYYKFIQDLSKEYPTHPFYNPIERNRGSYQTATNYFPCEISHPNMFPCWVGNPNDYPCEIGTRKTFFNFNNTKESIKTMNESMDRLFDNLRTIITTMPKPHMKEITKNVSENGIPYTHTTWTYTYPTIESEKELDETEDENCICDCDPECDPEEEEDTECDEIIDIEIAPEVKKVTFSDPVTIVEFVDGSKVKVRANKDDKFDRGVGLMVALAKRAYGDVEIDDDGKITETGIGFTNRISKLIANAVIPKTKEEKAESKRKHETKCKCNVEEKKVYPTDEEIHTLNIEKKELLKQQHRCKDTIDDLEKTRNEMSTLVDELKDKISVSKNKLNIAKMKKRIDNLIAEIKTTNTEIANSKDVLKSVKNRLDKINHLLFED